MTFEENPFRVLQVSIYATKATINERADELSFEDPDREEIFEQARTILLNPKKRISAEMRWFVGCSQAKEMKYISDCLSGNETDADADFDYENYSSLADLNFQLYKLEKNFLSDGDCVYIDGLYSELDAEEILEQINSARTKSKFPAVKDTAEIKSELKNIRYEIREKFQDFLKDMTRDGRIRFATDFADLLTDEDIGIIAEDFFECYRLEMNPFLEKTAEQIIEACKIKFDFKADFSRFFYLAEPAIKNFVEAIKPLDKFSIAVGTNNFDESKKIFYAVRNTAIKLFNEKNLIDYPLRITRMLEQNFSYLPSLAEKIREDIKFLIEEKKLLEEVKARQPTQAFLDAKAALDKIQKAIDDGLYFKQGFEDANVIFYIEVFKPSHEIIIRNVMLKEHMKATEWKYLNEMVAAIYIQVGNAMTWALRSKLAFEMFQKSLPYAEASGNAELISLAHKRITAWKNAANSEESLPNFIWWMIIIVILFFIFR